MGKFQGIEPGDLVFLPLGGTDEVGMNMALYHLDGRWIVVDCGMTFAGDSVPGVDLVFPEPDFIEERREALDAIVITHGHEDHIGALPYLWPRLRVPIYATPFTGALIREKMIEHGLMGEVALRMVSPLQRFEVGPFKIRYVPVAHSIPEANSLDIATRHGTVLHTGDWKQDDAPPIGKATPGTLFSEIGDAGCLALVGDSTNIFNDHESGSEKGVKEALLAQVADCAGRVLVTTFASNAGRLKSIAEVARDSGRQLVLAGRSMERIWRVAMELGYLDGLPTPLTANEGRDLPARATLICCTGCQGEARAALARIVSGDHRDLSLAPGDRVIFSSKIIPGNEKAVGALINRLALKDIDVVTERDAPVHVSGHPGRPELRALYGWLRPQIAIPVHGEPRHLRAHAAFAKEQGAETAIPARNGRVIRLAPGPCQVVDEVVTGIQYLDGETLVPFNDGGIGDRRKLASEGHVVALVLMDEQGGLLGEPEIVVRGMPDYDVGGAIDTSLVDAAEKAVSQLDKKRRLDEKAVSEAVRVALRRQCRYLRGKNCVVDVRVLILEEED